LEKEFRFSADRHFEDKPADVAGLYMNPPDNAIVLCVDGKPQMQALERSAPLLPLLPRVPARHSADYYRYGTTALFAAPDMLTGNVRQVITAKISSGFLKNWTKSANRGKYYISSLIITARINRKKRKSILRGM
jgi:hypothetical protein